MTQMLTRGEQADACPRKRSGRKLRAAESILMEINRVCSRIQIRSVSIPGAMNTRMRVAALPSAMLKPRRQSENMDRAVAARTA